MATWEQRRIGRTNLHVTSLGLGTATMGGSRIPMSNEERLKLVEAAWNAGVRYVDTAPFYGVGAAERAAGDALRDKPRDAWVLSTKVGRLLRPRSGGGGATDGRLAPMPFEVQYDYSYDGIMRSIEDSYQRLGLAKIDILLVHDIGVYQHGEEANAAHMKVLRDSGYRALQELKRTGVVDKGMIPKVDSAVTAIRAGVEKVSFVDGRVPHALLLEIFTDAGVGTEVVL